MSNEERTVIFQLPTVVSGSLACMEGTVTGRTWRLSAGTFVIGRADGSDLYMPTEPGVSKTHAKILAEGDHYNLIDNESRNGTIVNGHVVSRVMLADGDELQICGARFRFTQSGGEGRRGEIQPQNSANPSTAPSPAAAPPAAAPLDAAPSAAAQTDSAPEAAAATATIAREDFSPTPPAAPPAKGGSLFMPFLVGMFLVLVLGGGASAALYFLGGDGSGDVIASGPETTTNAPEAAPAADSTAEATAPTGTDGGTSEPAVPAPAATSPAASSPGAPSPAGQAPEGEPGAEPAAASAAPVTVVAGAKKPIRTRGGGRVRAVDATTGAQLTKGGTILRLDDVALAREIATATESVNALAAIAETSEGAKAALQEEKQKLRVLQSQARQQKVTAPISGTLVGMTVRAGDRVRPRQVIGFIRDAAGELLFASIPPADKAKWKKGAALDVQLKDGTKTGGRVAGNPEAKGATGMRVLITVDGDTKPTDVKTAALR